MEFCVPDTLCCDAAIDGAGACDTTDTIDAGFTSAQQVTIRQFLQHAKQYAEFSPLVERLLNQFSPDAMARQVLESEIYRRFCDLVDEHASEQGVPFRPYIVRKLTAFVSAFVWGQSQEQSDAAAPNCAGSAKDGEPSYDLAACLATDRLHRAIVHHLPHAISRLPDQQRKVVCWRYFDNSSFEEIAANLGIGLPFARSLHRDSLDNLRTMIQACLNI